MLGLVAALVYVRLARKQSRWTQLAPSDDADLELTTVVGTFLGQRFEATTDDLNTVYQLVWIDRAVVLVTIGNALHHRGFEVPSGPLDPTRQAALRAALRRPGLVLPYQRLLDVHQARVGGVPGFELELEDGGRLRLRLLEGTTWDEVENTARSALMRSPRAR